MFNDYKTGGYNLEHTKVNEARFLALVLLITIAYSWATIHGQWINKLGIEIYAGRINEYQDKAPLRK
jgi:hypothetical protein